MAFARSPRRLQQAREEGFLNARCRTGPALLRAYGLWCWRMSIPMVWYERRSRASHFSRVHLDMLTTPYRLSIRGRAELIGISAACVPPDRAVITAHKAVWDRIPPAVAQSFAKAVFRAVRRPDNYELLALSAGAAGDQDNVLPFTPPLAIPA